VLYSKAPDKDAGQDEREAQEGYDHINPGWEKDALGAACEVKKRKIVHTAKRDDKREKAGDPLTVNRQRVACEFPPAVGEDVDNLKPLKREKTHRGSQNENPGKNSRASQDHHYQGNYFGEIPDYARSGDNRAENNNAKDSFVQAGDVGFAAQYLNDGTAWPKQYPVKFAQNHHPRKRIKTAGDTFRKRKRRVGYAET